MQLQSNAIFVRCLSFYLHVHNQELYQLMSSSHNLITIACFRMKIAIVVGAVLAIASAAV